MKASFLRKLGNEVPKNKSVKANGQIKGGKELKKTTVTKKSHLRFELKGLLREVIHLKMMLNISKR